MADLAEVKRRADAVIREQDAIDFIDWCRDLAPVPTDAPGRGGPRGEREAYPRHEHPWAGCPAGCGHSWWPVGDDSYGCNAASPAPSRPEGLDVERLFGALYEGLLADPSLWPTYDPAKPSGYRGGPFDMDGRTFAYELAVRTYLRLSDTTTEASDG